MQWKKFFSTATWCFNITPTCVKKLLNEGDRKGLFFVELQQKSNPTISTKNKSTKLNAKLP